MASEIQSMTGAGRKEKVTDKEILRLLRRDDPPVWSARELAENTDITRQTAHTRLGELAEEHDGVETMKVGRATVYYYRGADADPSAPVEERHKESLIREFEDMFVGLPTAPWTAVHPNDGPAEAGDKVQIRVEGIPGQWRQQMTHTWDSRREELIYEETSNEETQALISGELYAKPTTPIEHTDYPDDYDLELNIGGEYQEVEGRDRSILVVAGVKNYLVKPCNNAVFLTGVSVDWISPKAEGQELESHSLDFDQELPHQALDAKLRPETDKDELKSLLRDGEIDFETVPPRFIAMHPNSPLESKEEVLDLGREAGVEREEDVGDE